MPVDVKLSEDQYYLIYTFTEPLEMKELMEAYKKEKELRDSRPHTVHSIVNLSALSRIPPNWLTAKAGPGLTHPRSGRMAFVGLSYGIRIIIQTILRISRYDRIQFFEKYEDAQAYMDELVQITKNNEESASKG